MVSVMTFNELVSTYARHLKVVGEEDQETSPGETSTWSTFNRIRTPIPSPCRSCWLAPRARLDVSS